MRRDIWTVVLCGLAGFALTAQAAAKDTVLNPGGVVDFYTNVSGVREVPAGHALPGLHVDAKFRGRTMDVYIAPMDFVLKYDVKLAKGDDVHVVGALVKAGEAKSGDEDGVLTREITTGFYDRRSGQFHPNMT